MRLCRTIVAAAVPVHLGLAMATDLSPDEAYYLCAARLGRRIVDHPPLVVWLLRLSDRCAFAPVELRVRVWAVLFSLATGLALVELARRRGAGPVGCAMAGWLGSWALLPTAGGFVTTPDGPLLLGVTLALVFAGTGAAGGALLAGALAKVSALPVAAALAVGDRGASLRARAVVAGLPLLALPVLWPSLRFQARHAFTATAPTGWSPGLAVGAVAGAVAAQAGLWSPVVVWRGMRGIAALPVADRALVWSLTVLVLASALVRGVPPEPNWWAPAALVMVAAFARGAGELSRRARWAILATVLVPTGLAAVHAVTPFLPLPERADPTARLHGWSRGTEPGAAPGVGAYGPAAEQCAYRGECGEISSYFNEMDAHE